MLKLKLETQVIGCSHCGLNHGIFFILLEIPIMLDGQEYQEVGVCRFDGGGLVYMRDDNEKAGNRINYKITLKSLQ